MTKFKLNWMYVAFAVISLYFAVLGYFVDLSDIGYFLRTKDLNNIGDFLAGTFAFPAFVLLALAVVTQRAELKETREQFEDSKDVVKAQLKLIEDQNTNSHNSAKANYRFLLHDKRVRVYRKLTSCGDELVQNGFVADELEDKLSEVAKEARFIFAEDVQAWNKKVLENARILRSLRHQKTKIEVQWSETSLPKHYEDEFIKLSDLIIEKESSIYKLLDEDNIDKIFGPSMTLSQEL